MINIELLQEKVNKVVENDKHHQVKAVVRLQIETSVIYAQFSFPFTGEQFQEMISLSSEIGQDEMLLLAHLSYMAGQTNEWRSVKHKMSDLAKQIISTFTIDL